VMSISSACARFWTVLWKSSSLYIDTSMHPLRPYQVLRWTTARLGQSLVDLIVSTFMRSIPRAFVILSFSDGCFHFCGCWLLLSWFYVF
jgi:hypothetical protein